jgi:UDP-3-O-[3-hydroxymyristoyl] glucosamine N-acyltransferase
VEDGAEIGDRAKLMGHVYVGARSRVGEDTLLYPNVVLREEVSVGKRCIVHAGAVLGSDGYGFYFAGGKHNKIPQVGTVVVEDDVEIGSCTTIDRATTGATIIRQGAKIDNLVQIAHNVEVGPHCLIVAQVGIAGSTKLGRGVVLAGQVGVADHAVIGDGAQVGAQSGIKGEVKPGEVLFGSPAQPVQETIRQGLLVRKLPELFRDMKKLKESLTPHE